jgi:hypothetical protein
VFPRGGKIGWQVSQLNHLKAVSNVGEDGLADRSVKALISGAECRPKYFINL